MNITIALVAAVIVLQIADGITTWRAISSGYGHEANALMLWLIDRCGLIGALVLAKAGVIAFIAATQSVGWWDGPAGIGGLGAIAVFYTVIVANNIRVIRGR